MKNCFGLFGKLCLSDFYRLNFMFLVAIFSISAIVLISCNKNEIPSLTTNAITDITATSACLHGNIISDGGANIIVRGFVWNTVSNPSLDANLAFSENGTTTGEYSFNLDDLNVNTTYYVRAYAKNSVGIAYGKEHVFTTLKELNGIPCPDCETVTDIEGNIYHTVLIGSQCWLVENLKTTKFNDAEQITNITNNVDWKNTTIGAFCYYENNIENKDIYGNLYNFYAVETGKLCPQGWHVASDNEWKQLEGFSDSNYKIGNPVWDDEGWRGSDAGKKLKSKLGWLGGSDENYSNEFGFSAKGGGMRTGNIGDFQRIKEWGLWWSDKNNDETNVYRRYMGNHDLNIARFPSNPKDGYSVKCIKNE